MQTDLKDFLLSGLALAGLAILTVLIVVLGVQPLSARVFGAYHWLVDGVAMLLVYGLLSSLLVRSMLAVFPLRPGEYRMNDPHFTYWKFYTVVHEFGRGALLPFTTVFAKPLVAMLFGRMRRAQHGDGWNARRSTADQHRRFRDHRPRFRGRRTRDHQRPIDSEAGGRWAVPRRSAYTRL